MRKCDYCGRENPDEAMHCSGCAGQLQEEPPVIKQTKAGFWIRVAARIIDFVFVSAMAYSAALCLCLLLIFSGHANLVSKNGYYPSSALGLLPLLCYVLGRFLYQVICEGIHGATLGKLCCGLRVVRVDGTPSTIKGAVIRNLAYIVDSLFFGAVAYDSMKTSPLNQRYGDVWGKTAVIKTREVLTESKRSMERFIFALGLGVFSYVALFLTGFSLKIWEAANPG